MENSGLSRSGFSIAGIQFEIICEKGCGGINFSKDFLPFTQTFEANNSNADFKIHLTDQVPLSQWKKVFKVSYPANSIMPGYGWFVFRNNDNNQFLFRSKTTTLEQLSFEAIFEPNKSIWFVAFSDGEIFPYPLSYIILYNSLLLHQSIILHSSFINYKGKAWLFSGSSGKGKTTISKLFSNNGYEVINDDKAVLRILPDNRLFAFNAPIYEHAINKGLPLERIFLIEHGKSNSVKKLNKIEATTLLAANCIQHNFDLFFTETLYNTIVQIAENIPVFRLAFKPDQSIINFLDELA